MMRIVRTYLYATFSRRLLWSLIILIATVVTTQAQSEIHTPYTGKVTCRQLLSMKEQEVVSHYERRFQAEAKWAMADYSRCHYNANFAAAKRLPSATQVTINRLREIVEAYFNAIYAMRAGEVGGGEPFELDEISAQIEVEELIGKAIRIYSKTKSAPSQTSRARAAEHLARVEGRLPLMTAPLKLSDLQWLDMNKEDDRQAAERLQQDHAEAANALRESVANMRSLSGTLPDALALLVAEMLDNHK